MILKLIPVASILLLAACSSSSGYKKADKIAVSQDQQVQAEKYTQAKNSLMSRDAIASSNNECVDNFNFLRQADSAQYQKFSLDYIKVGTGYKFLNVNKNIMGDDAKSVYTMKLDMKLDALCNKVNFASYQIIKQKIKELGGI
ncbi:hypothetical protein [Serratia aquatilis]|uniref:Lipoprotein n=1 Tax=Serratia aquatilis TaxID=1737515 RepID=A0ABV6EBN5_9GAMM